MTGGQDLVLVIDLGTQSMRATALDNQGRACFRRSYAVSTRREGVVCEQDPNQWRDLLVRLLCEAGAEDAVAGRVKAIVATATLSGLVCLDETGNVLRPALMYGDQRARPLVAKVEALAEFREAAARSGWRAHSGDFLPQLLYAATEEPEVYARARWTLDSTGFLNYLLTGEPALDEYTRFHCYSPPEEKGLLPGLFAALGVDLGKVGRLYRVGDRLGLLREELAVESGLDRCPVYGASYDSICAYWGADLLESGDALDISGTVTSFGVMHARQVIDARRRIFSLPWGGDWLVRGSTAMSGGVLEWARREIVHGGFDKFNALVESSPAGARGLLFLPYLAGERAPIWNENACGAFFGLTTQSTQADMARAVFEGLAYSLRHIQMVIEEQGVAIGTVRLAGGLSHNLTLSRIKASITGKTLRPLANPELTTLGCAAIAGTQLGWYRDRRQAADVLLCPHAEVPPDSAQRPLYENGFERYVRLVESVEPLFVARG